MYSDQLRGPTCALDVEPLLEAESSASTSMDAVEACEPCSATMLWAAIKDARVGRGAKGNVTSSANHITMAAAAAACVLVTAKAAMPVAFRALPPLKPNHPAQKKWTHMQRSY